MTDVESKGWLVCGVSSIASPDDMAQSFEYMDKLVEVTLNE